MSDKAPNRGMASSVIFHRHLSRLEQEGWGIHLICPEGESRTYEGHATWKTHFLPARRWWWPPFRPYGLRARIRIELLAQDCASFVRQSGAGVILGYLRGNYLAGLAAHLSRRHGVPLGYFYHDDTELFPDIVGRPKIRSQFRCFKAGLMEQASAVWAVSAPMLEEEGASAKYRLFYPLSEPVDPAPAPAWKPEFCSRPLLVHAGTVYREIVAPLVDLARALREIGGTLCLLTHTLKLAEEVRSQAGGAVEIRPGLPAAEAVAWIRGNAAGLVVMYPERMEEMPWIKTNFPSKFCQFTATGLPTLIHAPMGSALRRWADDKEYPAVLPAASRPGLGEAIRRCLERGSWERAAEICKEEWQGEFRPDGIHRRLADELETMAGRRKIRLGSK